MCMHRWGYKAWCPDCRKERGAPSEVQQVVRCTPVTDSVRHFLEFDADLARILSKIVHENCQSAPHDIGVVLALAVAKHQLK